MGLVAKVTQSLVLTNDGAKITYMTVDAQNAGSLTILPAPSYSGLYAQTQTTIGTPVNVQRVGPSTSKFAVLLNGQGLQYGEQMDYDRLSPALYLGNSEMFPRGKIFTNANNAKQSYMMVKVFGRDVPVRFSRIKADATPKELNEFQGFLIRPQSSDYVVWMPLTGENVSRATSTPNYLKLREINASYSFTRQGEPLSRPFLEQLVAEPSVARTVVSMATPAPARPAPVATPISAPPTPARPAPPIEDATIIVSDGVGSASYKLRPGTYTIAQLVEQAHEQGLSGRQKAVMSAVRLHVAANNPVLIGLDEFSKTGELPVQPGREYLLNMREVTREVEAVQPVARAEPRTEPRMSHRQQPAISSKPARQEYVAETRRKSSGG